MPPSRTDSHAVPSAEPEDTPHAELPRPAGARTAVRRALEGERERLRAFVSSLARDGAEADDVFQDVMERALRYAESYDAKRGATAWTRRIALHVLCDRRARSARERMDALPSHDTAPSAPCAQQAEVESGEEIERLLAPLSSVSRELMLRFHGAGESLTSLAKEFGLPIGTVKSTLHRARRELAQRREER